MKRSSLCIKGVAVFALILAVATGPGMAPPAPSTEPSLIPGASYTVVLSQMNPDGTLTDVSLTRGQADGDGRLAFSFSSVPTFPDVNFVVITIRNSGGVLVRRALCTAPVAGEESSLGANSLMGALANGLIYALGVAGSDDPILVAFGCVVFRTAGMTTAEAQALGEVARTAILGPIGFNGWLQSQGGVTAAQMTTLRRKLVHNKPNAFDLGDFFARFRTAVDASSDAVASEEMAIAGGFLADIFMDGAPVAEIDLSLILAAHEAAGQGADSSPSITQITPATMTMIGQAMTSFRMRMKAVKVKKEYYDALTTLGAAGSDVNAFLSAIDALAAAMQLLDSQYASYFENPSTMTPAIQAQIDAAFQAAFNSFGTAVRASNAQVASMRQAISTATGIALAALPAGLGTDTDQFGNPVNWSIPKVVLFTWVAGVISNGGSITYTRSTLPIPAMMLGWLPARTVFATANALFNAVLGVQEDVMIAQFTMWDTFNMGPVTPAVYMAGQLAFQQNLGSIAGSIGGQSTAFKEAIVLLMLQPSFD